ncbi:MAG: XdhC family protein [Bacteroidetes bacterium]|nr:XdhC family protein [Bacteroidota bacterium]
MKEIKDIVQAFDEATRLQQKTALATVVHVSGSSYRRPGARMLVREDGQLTGAISGGCLEGDALRKAVLAITQGKNKLVIYDTTDEDDAKLGVQLGCNGIVSILFEPVNADQPNHPIQLLRRVIAERKPAILVTGYSLNQNDHIGTTAMADLPAVVSSQIQSTVATVLAEQQSVHLDLPIEANQQHFFVEYCRPSIALVVVGAGNDALPLVNMAHVLGWEITVVDGRVTHATTQRFPLADSIIVAKPKEAAARLQTDARTALVLMTHNYNYDLDMLQQLPATDIAYIGMLGPAAKRNRMLDELAAQGIVLEDGFLEKIYGPTGIDLGAETAAEIALSITAEIMSVLQDTPPVHLREKKQAIHHRAV